MLTTALSAIVCLSEVLVPGANAPQFTVEKFVSGEPVKSFEAGKVYVLEFWATWCGPCIRAMPHLAELQKKHPEIVIVGVAGFERAADASGAETKVTDFLKSRGGDVGFRIAMDTDGSMGRDWMQAARRNGIPCSFVVGKDGKVAYIGSPNASLDQAIVAALGADAGEAGGEPAAPAAVDGAKPASPPDQFSKPRSPSRLKDGAGPGDGPAKGDAPVRKSDSGDDVEVTESTEVEPTSETGESRSQSSSASSSAEVVNGVTVTRSVTETVTVTVKDGKRTTVTRREVRTSRSSR